MVRGRISGKPVAATHPQSVACGRRKVHWPVCHRQISYGSCQLQVLSITGPVGDRGVEGGIGRGPVGRHGDLGPVDAPGRRAAVPPDLAIAGFKSHDRIIGARRRGSGNAQRHEANRKCKMFHCRLRVVQVPELADNAGSIAGQHRRSDRRVLQIQGGPR